MLLGHGKATHFSASEGLLSQLVVSAYCTGGRLVTSLLGNPPPPQFVCAHCGSGGSEVSEGKLSYAPAPVRKGC